MQDFRRWVEKGSYGNFAALRAAFGTVDKVGPLYVFNIGGNKYRLVAALSFKVQALWVKAVVTHLRRVRQGEVEMIVQDVFAHWEALHEVLGLGVPIANKAAYLRALAGLDELADATAGVDDHPLWALIGLAGDRSRGP